MPNLPINFLLTKAAEVQPGTLESIDRQQLESMKAFNGTFNCKQYFSRFHKTVIENNLQSKHCCQRISAGAQRQSRLA